MPTCTVCGGTGTVADPRVEGLAMRRARERAGLSLRETAGRAKVSAAYLCDLELGRRRWREALRQRVLKAIGRLGAAQARAGGS